MKPEFHVAPTPDAVAALAADRLEQLATAAIAARGRFLVALAGGSTPERLYRLLVTRPLPWDAIDWYFSDERFVPLTDPSSNFGLAQRTLFGNAPIAGANIHAVPTDAPTPEDAAIAYAATLPERFDLVLLGLGDDGHTASLFPGKPALGATTPVTFSEPGVLPPPVPRVTFTFPTINRARAIFVLATGANKAEKVAAWRGALGTVDTLPILGVRPESGRLDVFLDAAAAGQGT